VDTERMNESYHDLDLWPSAGIIEAVVEANAQAVEAVRRALAGLERAAQGVFACLARGGRLVYVGAGTSGRLALLDAAELYPTFGFERSQVLLAGGSQAWARAQEGAEDDEAAAVDDAGRLKLGANDAVIGLAASGRTPYTLAALRFARERGAFTVGLANNPASPLLEVAEVGVLLDTGPEVLAGSTRLAAGTAQKVALNALSTAVLVRLGGAYGNRMVGMKAVNDKLRERALRMVADATGAAPESARDALRRADWRIREAIVMLELDCSFEEARQRLIMAQDRVRDALARE
jgi:N-acetylmuramic acid 6-phosphate etherase